MTVAHKVKITYCAECGYEPQTLELAKALMVGLGARLSCIELIPWEDGAFDVSFDGELLHSMKREGGFPDAKAMVDAVRTRLSR
ncbi:MAG TPA: Rdx family protein [Candidatus Limnocylindria bacterium]|jgi:selenoprotein W-related protein